MSDYPESIAAIGMFDGIHLGHRHLLDTLMAQGRRKGLLPLAVTFPDHPLMTIRPETAPALITPDAAVKRHLIAAAGVDRCLNIAFSRNIRPLTAAEFMAYLRNNYNVRRVVIGWDHRFGSDGLTEIGAYRRAGLQAGVEVSSATKFLLEPSDCRGTWREVSSSAIRSALAEGDVATAAAMLGRDFSFSGTVTGGNRLGRTIGFPTANLRLSPRQQVPASGVYAVRVSDLTSGTTHMGVANLGHRPTVASALGADFRIEVHLLDFCADIYGHTLEVSFVCRLRPEKKFPSLEALRTRLAIDVFDARNCFAARGNGE